MIGEQACDRETTLNTSAKLVYRYGFQPRSAAAGGPGWYDPASGKAALYFTGGVRYAYDTRGIDLQFNDPEIEINGADSRMIFRFVGADGTEIPSHRAVFVNFDRAGAGELVPTGSGALSSTRLFGSLSADSAESVFNGFYPAGSTFGWAEVRFTPGT